MSIQSSINSMLGSASQAVFMTKHLAGQKANKSNDVKKIVNQPAQPTKTVSSTQKIADNIVDNYLNYSRQAQAAEIAMQHRDDAIQAKKDQQKRIPIYGAKGEIING